MLFTLEKRINLVIFYSYLLTKVIQRDINVLVSHLKVLVKVL